jgi:hypothetical protein
VCSSQRDFNYVNSIGKLFSNTVINADMFTEAIKNSYSRVRACIGKKK